MRANFKCLTNESFIYKVTVTSAICFINSAILLAMMDCKTGEMQSS